MGVKVAKFGGSSVADALQIGKIKNIIENDPDIHYVVVSAPGKRFSDDSKVTDLLYLCKAHIEHNLPYQQIFQVICDRFMAVEVNLGVNVGLREEFEEIRKNLEAGASADYIASRGEHLNAMLIAAYLGFDFVDSSRIVRFDEKGRFMEDLTNKEIAEELKHHERAVIPDSTVRKWTVPSRRSPVGALILQERWWQELLVQMFMKTGQMYQDS